MDMALYQPGEGYYVRQAGLIGPKGDFYTAPRLSPVFGELIADQIAEFWERLGSPTTFQVVEMGGGQGLLAGDILSRLHQSYPDVWAALRYTLAEISEPLRLAQQRRLAAIPGGAEIIGKVGWRNLEELEPGEITGCFVSNELVDAFPVHLVTIQGGAWREVYVSLSEAGELSEIVGPLSDPALTRYLAQLDFGPESLEEDYRTEINLRMLDWLTQVARALDTGYILTIDYGYSAAHRYHPLKRSGTLQCYSNHRVHDNPYIAIGRQDITSHVDFSGLTRQGETLGLSTVGLTKQANFLLGLGLGQKLAKLSLPVPGLTNRQQLAEREALQRLINPAGLGNFGVLIQGRGLPPGATKLAGLSL